MKLPQEEIERLDRIAQRFPKRYFDMFRVQRQFFAASLDDSFFRFWFDSLTFHGQDLRKNFSNSSASCTWLLLLHSDCPDWLRDHYKNFAFVDGRRAAYLGGSESYQFLNIDGILSDRSKTIKEEFFYKLNQALIKNNDLDPNVVVKALKFVKNSSSRHLNFRRKSWQPNPIIIFYKEFETALDEGVGGLVSPDSKIRSKSEFLFKQPPEILEKIRLIIKGEG